MLAFNTLENLSLFPKRVILETEAGVEGMPFNTRYSNVGTTIGSVSGGSTTVTTDINCQVPLPTFTKQCNFATLRLWYAFYYLDRVLEVRQIGVKDQFFNMPIKPVGNTYKIDPAPIMEGFAKYGIKCIPDINDPIGVNFLLYNEGITELTLGFRTPFVSVDWNGRKPTDNTELSNGEIFVRLAPRTYNDISKSAPNFHYARNTDDNFEVATTFNGSLITAANIDSGVYEDPITKGNVLWDESGKVSPDNANYTDLSLISNLAMGNKTISVQLKGGLITEANFNLPDQTQACTFWDADDNVIVPQDPTKWTVGAAGNKIFIFARAQVMLSNRNQFNRTLKSNTIKHMEINGDSMWRVRNARTGDFSQPLTATALQTYLTGETVPPANIGNIAFNIVNEMPMEDLLEVYPLDEYEYGFVPTVQGNLTVNQEADGAPILLYLAAAEEPPIECTPSNLELTTGELITSSTGVELTVSINDEPWINVFSASIGDGSVYGCWDALVSSNNMLQYIVNTKFQPMDNGTSVVGISGLPGTADKTVVTSLRFKATENATREDFFNYLDDKNEVLDGIVTVTSCGSLD